MPNNVLTDREPRRNYIRKKLNAVYIYQRMGITKELLTRLICHINSEFAAKPIVEIPRTDCQRFLIDNRSTLTIFI